LPFGYRPVCAASLGTSIVIGAIQTTNSGIIQGKASLFFWDAANSPRSFYNQIDLDDPLVTALRNINGILHVFSGNVTTGSDTANGYQISVYIGGQSLRQIYSSAVGSSPLHYAISSVGQRIVWGTFAQVRGTSGSAPSYYAVLMALGSKDSRLQSGAHCIAKASCDATASDGWVTCILKAQQDSYSYPKFIIGWRDANGSGLDKQSTTYGVAVYQSQNFVVNRPFTVKKIRVPLGAAVAASMTITPKLLLDNFSSEDATGLTVINNTNYPDGDRYIVYEPNVSGKTNFCLEFAWSGTALLPITVPIEIDVETIDPNS
jgi:hypothetical protein